MVQLKKLTVLTSAATAPAATSTAVCEARTNMGQLDAGVSSWARRRCGWMQAEHKLLGWLNQRGACLHVGHSRAVSVG